MKTKALICSLLAGLTPCWAGKPNPPPTPSPNACVAVISEVACFAPGDTCGNFSRAATAFGTVTSDPAFRYRITVTNCGTVALTHLAVVNDRLGTLTPMFFLQPAQHSPRARV